jgi:hypothetical protein
VSSLPVYYETRRVGRIEAGPDGPSFVYESEGQEFESLRVRQSFQGFSVVVDEVSTRLYGRRAVSRVSPSVQFLANFDKTFFDEVSDSRLRDRLKFVMR